MRYKLSLLAVLFISGTFLTGCARTEAKFGRGISNTMEAVRLGEWRRSMEQTALFHGPDTGYSTGFFSGLNRSLARTGVGIYEVVTAPFPPYDPVFTDYLSPKPAYPDNYKPNLLEDSLFATDANLGFSGGDISPLVPGSRFRIFDTH
jgi:putative exosortase-associated protein (TIGR04073 family)